MPAVLGNLQNPGLLDDPYPTYRRLLAAGPTRVRKWAIAAISGLTSAIP
jgi:hypothetical protein